MIVTALESWFAEPRRREEEAVPRTVTVDGVVWTQAEAGDWYSDFAQVCKNLYNEFTYREGRPLHVRAITAWTVRPASGAEAMGPFRTMRAAMAAAKENKNA